ncbi:MAG: alginate export family protein [Gammaproteobacteria bacterium]|nr:alginate export family protein [Gammaproteobacteria bacterium]
MRLRPAQLVCKSACCRSALALCLATISAFGADFPGLHFDYGGDFRVRNDFLDGAITLSTDAPHHQQNYLRLRERVWASVADTSGWRFKAGLSGEQRDWYKPAFASQFPADTGFEARYGIVDQLFVEWQAPGGRGPTVTIGRQDILFGERMNGWLVSDGTPYDASWTAFFDAARVRFTPAGTQTQLDLVCLVNFAKPDAWLPTIGDSSRHSPGPYYLTEQDERGVILYASNHALAHTDVDAYYMAKLDDRVASNGDDAELHTLGGRVRGEPGSHWLYSLEGAYQFGSKRDAGLGRAYGGGTWLDISAWGLNGRAAYRFRDRYDDQLTLVFEYLSGDDPQTTGRDEMFDILWSRWPRWSELFVHDNILEVGGRPSQMANLERAGLAWSVTPLPAATLTLGYNALWAPEALPTRALDAARANSPLFSREGNFRGHDVQAQMLYQIDKHLSVHLWADGLWQGGFYRGGELITFFRAELLATF